MNMSRPNATSARVSVGAGPRHIAVSNSDQFPLEYVPDQSDNTVTVLKFPTVVDTIRHKSFNVPQAVAYNPTNELIYVANYGTYPQSGNTVSVIKGTNWVTDINVGNGPAGIAYNPIENMMFVTNEFSSSPESV